jgi:ribosome-associated protein
VSGRRADSESSARTVPSPVIPGGELRFTFARSGGPGGQNVNKVSSKATLHWSVLTSAALGEETRARLVAMFGKRINRDGALVIVSQRYRDRTRNVADCLEKLGAMLAAASRPPKRRRATRPTVAARERRLEEKRAHAAKKTARRRRPAADEG